MLFNGGEDSPAKKEFLVWANGEGDMERPHRERRRASPRKIAWLFVR